MDNKFRNLSEMIDAVGTIGTEMVGSVRVMVVIKDGRGSLQPSCRWIPPRCHATVKLARQKK